MRCMNQPGRRKVENYRKRLVAVAARVNRKQEMACKPKWAVKGLNLLPVEQCSVSSVLVFVTSLHGKFRLSITGVYSRIINLPTTLTHT